VFVIVADVFLVVAIVFLLFLADYFPPCCYS
jgi:hypothetical protein